jgi:hypothetical protein
MLYLAVAKAHSIQYYENSTIITIVQLNTI